MEKIYSKQVDRVLIGGSGSGCGKTTMTMAILSALRFINKKVSPYKCGPDYIDPLFHSRLGAYPCRNLDLFLCGEKGVLASLGKAEGDLAIIEGVMGLYDGIGFDSDRFSSNHVAKVTQSPTIMVFGVKGKAQSLLAEIGGYLVHLENNIKGILLNHCSKALFDRFKPLIEEKFKIPVLGFLPPVDFVLESRHLGLVLAEEIENLTKKTYELGQTALKTIDIPALLALAATAASLSVENKKPEPQLSLRLGVPMDRAFCFYYQDNLDVFTALGAEIVPFSPIKDAALPKDLDGLYFGGGYPELCLDQLEKNQSLRREIKERLEGGLPCFAECGGFMYLGGQIEGREMVGFFNSDFVMTKALKRFGYVTLTAEKDCILCKKGETIGAHEFHYSDGTENGSVFTATKESGAFWGCYLEKNNCLGGYPHLHFYGNMGFATRFILACRGEKI